MKARCAASISILQTIIGLAGAHQVQNANLAVHLAREFLNRQTGKEEPTLSPAVVEGLVNAKWPGRCQAVLDPKYPQTSWYLDGAHTVESLDCCMQWFVSPGVGIQKDGSKKPTRVLIFNCTSGRSGDSFLGAMLAKAAAQLQLHGHSETAEAFFDHAIFCANVTYADGGFKGDLTTKAIAEDDLAVLKTQTQLAAAWRALHPSFPASNVHVLPSIEHAVKIVRGVQSDADAAPVAVLVAGSLHLVGGLIEVAGLAEVAL
ncbi:hypothetical protein HGRIS_009459 [Hohenbuehelia grisea]|uniref:tetrahydrofolate synthase n=1 Tax=Hohenbuehelia grisea TaxID=104357 RepID=A0ABR3J1R2_9AGAR